MAESSFPSFADFYEAVHRGRRPFPWQDRLAQRVVESGWPEEIGVPTGLGKTSCLDIAVWSLASQAGRAPAERTLPIRTWYVVNRRLLVDAAYEHAESLRHLLAHPGSLRGSWAEATAEHVAHLVAVRGALMDIRGFGTEADDPLVVTRLRGGAELGARPPHPAQPTLVLATVPMFASTWLFRGYASSYSMRPVDAAHAGTDSLVLLDEAHLSRPLRDLCGPIEQCDVGDSAAVVNAHRARPTLVSLTATGDAVDPFTLDADDEAHPVVRARLDAPKRIELRAVQRDAKGLAPDLARATSDLLSEVEDPSAIVVFTNQPSRARAVFDLLAKESGKKKSALPESDIVLLTGRMRRREAELARRRVLDPVSGAPSNRDQRAPRERHLVVVATQTLEVGADLDFDLLVTESCGSRALVQRLGRLNRLGIARTARGLVVHPTKEKDWGLYGEEPAEVWDRLQGAAVGDVVELPPSRVAEVVGEPRDRPARVAELLPAHLWEWAKTTTPPPGEAPVEPFFEGFGTDGPRVSLCWRATRFAPGDRLIPSLSIDESVDLPLGEARAALVERFGDDAVVTRLAADRVTVEHCAAAAVRPSDIVVLDVGDGLYDEHGWGPDGRAVVLDVSIERWPGLPLDPASLNHWCEHDDGLAEVIGFIGELDGVEDDVDVAELADRLFTAVRELHPRAEVATAWDELVGAIKPQIDRSGSIAVLGARRVGWRGRGTVLLAADGIDDLCAVATSEKLDDHLSSVGTLAQAIGESVGLPPELVAAVAAAGRFHDLGKADHRFQRWLDPGSESEGRLLAKSGENRIRWRADRAASGWPSGGRHEALSARMVEEWLDGQDAVPWDRHLVVHLVISHHGKGRPLVAPVEDASPTTCSYELDGQPVSVSGDLAVADWDQPSRFRRCCERYGYWGLALLEAIVRQADHVASSAIASGPVEVA